MPGRNLTRAGLCTALLLGSWSLVGIAHAAALTWTAENIPQEAAISGGPWTLEQTGASEDRRAAGYCAPTLGDAAGTFPKAAVQVPNPGTERMQPYYFPFTEGRGNHLQGLFDYRPRNIDEAVVAAHSDDGGRSWTFQQEKLELFTGCPPSEITDNGNDDGLGHAIVLTVGGKRFLYSLDRRVGHIDVDGLIVHQLHPTPGAPLGAIPALGDPDTAVHTVGLIDPDTIIDTVPGVSPTTVMYLEKHLAADNTGPTALPANQVCPASPTQGAANHDIVTPHLATTTDGVHFTTLNVKITGLNDPTNVLPGGTRYVGPRGTIIGLEGHRWGLFFSGGNCLDADSDAFHYIGYAESSDLVHWTVVNDINNPIASIAPIAVNAAGTALGTGAPTDVTIPAQPPVVGSTQGWWAGRVYAPSLTRLGDDRAIMVFAGYHTSKPKNDLGDYRTIGRVTLEASDEIRLFRDDGDGDFDEEEDHHHDR